jgi:hypothetical protein
MGTLDPSAKLDVNGGTGTGVYSYSSSAQALYGQSSSATAVYGTSHSGIGVYGDSYSNYGVYGHSSTNYAGYFVGNVAAFGYLDVTQYTSGGNITVCRNNTRLSVCSSSLRYKTDITPFHRGLDLINRLRPINFTWKADGSRDFGLGAEDVATVEPLLVTHNERGEVEGVKYERVSVVLINAIKEQQREIEQLRARLNRFERAAKSRHGSRRRSAR